ncbi:SRPBCC family protein [bacterium]|nr:MAG: SRPBCC family protein [bacterium]
MSARPVIVATTILKPRSEVYAFWRDWSNLPRFSPYLKTVQETSAGRTHWVAKGPTGDVAWDAETTVDERDRTIAWRSLEGAQVANAGQVEFSDAPGDRGTEVKVSLSYDAPGGKIGAFAAKLSGLEPEQEVAETLRRVKAILECGEVPVVEGQPSNQMRGSSQPGDAAQVRGVR